MRQFVLPKDIRERRFTIASRVATGLSEALTRTSKTPSAACLP